MSYLQNILAKPDMEAGIAFNAYCENQLTEVIKNKTDANIKDLLILRLDKLADILQELKTELTEALLTKQEKIIVLYQNIAARCDYTFEQEVTPKTIADALASFIKQLRSENLNLVSREDVRAVFSKYEEVFPLAKINMLFGSKLTHKRINSDFWNHLIKTDYFYFPDQEPDDIVAIIVSLGLAASKRASEIQIITGVRDAALNAVRTQKWLKIIAKKMLEQAASKQEMILAEMLTKISDIKILTGIDTTKRVAQEGTDVLVEDSIAPKVAAWKKRVHKENLNTLKEFLATQNECVWEQAWFISATETEKAILDKIGTETLTATDHKEIEDLARCLQMAHSLRKSENPIIICTKPPYELLRLHEREARAMAAIPLYRQSCLAHTILDMSGGFNWRIEPKEGDPVLFVRPDKSCNQELANAFINAFASVYNGEAFMMFGGQNSISSERTKSLFNSLPLEVKKAIATWGESLKQKDIDWMLKGGWGIERTIKEGKTREELQLKLTATPALERSESKWNTEIACFLEPPLDAADNDTKRRKWLNGIYNEPPEFFQFMANDSSTLLLGLNPCPIQLIQVKAELDSSGRPTFKLPSIWEKNSKMFAKIPVGITAREFELAYEYSSMRQLFVEKKRPWLDDHPGKLFYQKMQKLQEGVFSAIILTLEYRAQNLCHKKVLDLNTIIQQTADTLYAPNNYLLRQTVHEYLGLNIIEILKTSQHHAAPVILYRAIEAIKNLRLEEIKKISSLFTKELSEINFLTQQYKKLLHLGTQPTFMWDTFSSKQHRKEERMSRKQRIRANSIGRPLPWFS